MFDSNRTDRQAARTSKTTNPIARTVGSGALAALVAAALLTAQAPRVSAQAAAPNAKVERGRYLVDAMGCNDCHTPWKMGPNGPEMDFSRRLSGHPETLTVPAVAVPSAPWMAVVSATMTAWTGPWGTSFTANLTPDPETGLGKWTEQDFHATMKSGRHQGRGRPLLPPMPYFNVGGLTDEDISAVFAYLQSLPPIKNKVPQPIPPKQQ